MWLIFKAKMLIVVSKISLDENILFGKIIHHLDPDPEIRKGWEGARFGTRIPHSVLVHDLLDIEIDYSISDTDNGIEFKSPCKINHGPEMNVGFSIPMQTHYRHLKFSCLSSTFKGNRHGYISSLL